MFLRRTSRQKLEVSLDEPLNTDWDGNELLLSDILGTEGDMVYRSIEETVERQMLARALSKLSAREKEIMRLRFGLGGCAEKTQKQVADIMGISQSYISRLEKRILNRLQKDMTQMDRTDKINRKDGGCQADKPDISRKTKKEVFAPEGFQRGFRLLLPVAETNNRNRKALWWGDGAKPHVRKCLDRCLLKCLV